MENRKENRTRDARLDLEIDRWLRGEHDAPDGSAKPGQVAREFARLAAEESPRLSNVARSQGLNALRVGAANKRAQHRTNPFGFLSAVPRWSRLAAVALVVVLIANGVGVAAADSLPGSWLYSVKRFGEGGQLLLQNSNGQRAQLWMNFADTRLDEVQRLLAGGTRVDPSYLDAVDESILRALSELAGTRGDERVELLKKLTALTIRQQQILAQLAQNASSLERARLEQTAKFLQGVAGYAQSPQAADDPTFNPMQFLTPSPTPTATPTLTPTSLPTATALPPTGTTMPIIVPTETDATANPNPTDVDDDDETETPDATDAPDDDETETPDATDAPDDDETETPDATDAPDDDETETPDATDAPDDDETETPEATDAPDDDNDQNDDGKSDDDNDGGGDANDNGDDNSGGGDHDGDDDDDGGANDKDDGQGDDGDHAKDND